jgi:hypothetical protein
MSWKDIDPLGAALWNLFFPKQKKTVEKPDPLETPTVSKGVPISVIFGTVDKNDPFCAYFGDVQIKTIKVKGGGKK